MQIMKFLNSHKKKGSYIIHKNLLTKTKHTNKKTGKMFFVKIFKILIILIFSIILMSGAFAFWRFNKNVLKELPDLTKVQDMVFSQTTEIQDKNGITLYKLFQENRNYVEFDKISPNMINAIVSMEDQRYRTHGGLDPIGITRAALSNFFRFLGDPGGASTLTQQLLKNLLLKEAGIRETFIQKVARKGKEIVLASRLENMLEKQIKTENSSLTKDELHRKMKEKALELYLNFISFGNNAYGVEAASKTYFGITAKELSPLQASILASLPKAPSKYNPYRNKTFIMGDLIVTDTKGEKITLNLNTNLENNIIDRLKKTLTETNLSDKKQNGEFTRFIKGLGSFEISFEGSSYKVSYILGRKDAALARMYEDNKITELQLKNAFLEGLTYKFHEHKFEIKAPHFVHRVIEELEKQYDKETLMNGGLIIKTTLDYEIQKIAENSILNNKKNINDYGANNESMIYLDTTNGDIIAYVGSIDYFSEEIQGKNDMARRPRQPGSTMKSLIYALAFQKLPLTIDTPIYDIPFTIGKDQPNNADGAFMGLMPLKKALAYSRNIPAAKTIQAIGGEAYVKPLLIKMGLNSLKSNHEYGYPLALGAGEVGMIEMANLYSHLTNGGKPAQINPILEIRSKNGSILYKKETTKQEEVIKPGVAYLMRKILSDPSNMPPGRVSQYTVRGLRLGIKSGTSNMKVENEQDRARDGRLVGYTPNKVAVFRAGNTDGSPMFKKAYGGFLNSPAFQKFFSDLLKNNHIINQDMTPTEVTQITISKISGRLAGPNTPDELKESTRAYIYNQPSIKDDSTTSIQIDKLCKGIVGPYTPEDDMLNGYLISPSSFMPSNMDLNEIKERRKRTNINSGDIIDDTKYQRNKKNITYNFIGLNYLLELPKEQCIDRIPKEDKNITIDILRPKSKYTTNNFDIRYNIQGPRIIKEINIYIDNNKVSVFSYGNKSNITDIKNIKISNFVESQTYTLKVEAIDIQGFSNHKEIKIGFVKEDKNPPILLKDKIQIEKNQNGGYDITLIFEDELSSVVGGKIAQGTKVIHEFVDNISIFTIQELGEINLAVTDSYKNINKETINLQEYYIETHVEKNIETYLE